jgi:hypothetical protein
MFSKDFKEFLQLLIKNEVDYLIVGGYAVGYHGYPRFTGDLDIWLNPVPQNSKKIMKCIDEFGFSSLGLTENDFTKIGNVIQLGSPPLRIDILNDIDGVVFDDCYRNKVNVEIDEMLVNFISYHDLIKNKKATGRHRDLDDLENLQQ